MLPCNVTVEQTDAGSVIRVVDPEAMLGTDLAEAGALSEVAQDASARLKQVLQALLER